MRHFNILQTAESIYTKVINLRKTRCLYLNADADGDANTDAEISKWSLIIAIHILLNISRSKDNEN